jgi:NAD(P)-dependent dehydrogenase (short-subunit alcohol dehydrogenase family)
LKGVSMKTALVTGASSGIGDATAERLVMAGYKVYGTSRRAAKANQRLFELLPLDVTSDESVEATVAEVLRVESRIDLRVNNASFGVAPAGGEESSMEQARSIFETNVFGLVLERVSLDDITRPARPTPLHPQHSAHHHE